MTGGKRDPSIIAREQKTCMSRGDSVLVHLASGIGNIMLATPLLATLSRHGFVVDVLLDADYDGVAELLQDLRTIRKIYDGRRDERPNDEYAAILAAIPPFYWSRYRQRYVALSVYRPPDALFHTNEQAYYLDFARRLGCNIDDDAHYAFPLLRRYPDSPTKSVVIAPGSKPGLMASKRWPFFPELANCFDDVVLVGTNDDLVNFDGSRMHFPTHVRSFIDQLSLQQTSMVMSGARVVVANDSGLGHIAAALGVPTVLIFGPTADAVLGPMPPNARVLRRGLQCEPCSLALRACKRQVDCLRELSVFAVTSVIKEMLSWEYSTLGSPKCT